VAHLHETFCILELASYEIHMSKRRQLYCLAKSFLEQILA